MSSGFEIIAVIIIIIAQLVIAYRVYNQIQKMKTFLPNGKTSLALEEYEVPADKILDLEPRDIVGNITYRPVVPNAEQEGENGFILIDNDDELPGF